MPQKKSQKKPARPSNPRWARYSDKKLLEMRICDLGLQLEGTWLEAPVDKLYGELEAKGLQLRPHFWLSEEWFCPDGVPGIAIPFYLAHPRLIRLERKQMLEAEGANQAWCMKIMRHETGHAIQNAYNLHRRKRWQQLFGKNSTRYPDTYRPRPKSKNYVLHLYLWYAQSHPAEDFAETFAVWLRPRSQWRKRYADWPALKKLEYVDELMGDLAGVPPKVRSRRKVDALPQLKQTLGEYYEAKRSRYANRFPNVYDRDLLRLFSRDEPGTGAASAFLRKNRREIRQMIAKWTGEYAFTLDEVFTDMIGRCRELNLRVVGNEREVKLDFAILLTVRTMQFLNTRPHATL